MSCHFWGEGNKKNKGTRIEDTEESGEADVPGLGADCGQWGENRSNQLGKRLSAEGKYPGQGPGFHHLWILPSSTQTG